MSAIEVRGLTIALRDGSPIVKNATFDLEPGQVLGVVGESGSGKSTMSLAMLGYARHGARITAGQVLVDGTDVLSLGPRALRRFRGNVVAYVPQDPATALNPALRIGVQLAEGLDGDAKEVDARIREVLAAVGLPSDDAFLQRRPRELSGGQQQRVALAMAVAPRPRLTVLDEPTTGLDVTTQARVLSLVARLCADNQMAAIYVSHDLAVIGEVADRVAVMYGGMIVEEGPTREVVARPAHPYTRALLAAVPSARERMRLTSIPGRAPGVQDTYSGCVFAPRCAFAVDECTTRVPSPVDLTPGHSARCIRAEEMPERPRQSAAAPASAVRDAAPGETPLLRVRDLTAGYRDRQVLFDVSFDVVQGECLAVVGESGSGKTTMSRSLIGLQERWGGSVELGGAPLAPTAGGRDQDQRRSMQYIFQNPYGSLNPRGTVGDSVAEPLRHFFGLGAKAARQRVAELLERVELPAHLAFRYPAELSGGQRQRVAIARALACEPTVLICDEVTSALDVSVQAAIVELLRSLLHDGLGMVFVTHNLAVVRSLADSVIVLSGGHVVEHGGTDAVLTEPRHGYTQALLADTLEVSAAAG
ncbi:ABC transporter ATP-binding protein [Sphaerisporangium siamense]|uniref:Peptide/nickel transport system ATP-binding protein n=1 Tax=Sphaerisporangium siamense TaxID=795645 RepID=A0A7W7G9Y3_9ACTN|nr:ABC transporter ATP-binding protein [Sphaerisporangium siamense]MBB4699431.1 peptide/nickel transport system ATP-binding protein [Sphaerisporangium siamense]GII86842.1 ABC transporter ATP-binding protein [Sphaerisporangium siamense]